MSAVKPPTVAFVIPCYNEQAGIQHTLTYLLADITRLEKSKAISPGSYVTLVDDGSTDRTWDLIEKISRAHPKRVHGLKLSRMSDIRMRCWPDCSRRSEKPMQSFRLTRTCRTTCRSSRG